FAGPMPPCPGGPGAGAAISTTNPGAATVAAGGGLGASVRPATWAAGYTPRVRVLLAMAARTADTSAPLGPSRAIQSEWSIVPVVASPRSTTGPGLPVCGGSRAT